MASSRLKEVAGRLNILHCQWHPSRLIGRCEIPQDPDRDALACTMALSTESSGPDAARGSDNARRLGRGSVSVFLPWRHWRLSGPESRKTQRLSSPDGGGPLASKRRLSAEVEPRRHNGYGSCQGSRVRESERRRIVEFWTVSVSDLNGLMSKAGGNQGY